MFSVPFSVRNWKGFLFMENLKDRIKQDGQVLPGNVLKVNSFLNHQIDSDLMYEIGQEFAKRFDNEKITRILTVESSGIAPALMVGLALHVPVVFARKQKSAILNGEVYSAKVYSYTKQVENIVGIDKKFLQADDQVLIIDDFMANGEAVKGLVEIANQAQAKVVGVGIVIEKAFQNGGQSLRQAGLRVESLAQIASFIDNQVHFLGEE